MDTSSATAMTFADYDILDLITGVPSVPIQIKKAVPPPYTKESPKVQVPDNWCPPPY